MNSSDHNDNGTMFIVLGSLLLIGFAVWIMNTFEISFAAAFTTTLRLIAWGAVVAALIAWDQYSGLSVIKSTLPLIVSFFWWTLFPVLNYNAGYREDFPVQMDIEWYGTTLWQFIIFLGINLIGYGIVCYLYRRQSDYY